MMNILNTDQASIQIKRLGKGQHIDSAQRCTNGRVVIHWFRKIATGKISLSYISPSL